MTIDEITQRVKDIYGEVDAAEYPQTAEILETIASDETILTDVTEFLDKLFDADGRKATLPTEVAHLLMDIYAEEANNDNADAYCKLGSLYYTGRGGVQNYAVACKYYEKAEKLGSIQARENLGYCYYYGRTGKVDYEKAFHYFVKGALAGNINSLYKIGDMYKNGYFVEKDEQEAFSIYKHCLEGLNDDNVKDGGADIFIRLGDCHFTGMGTEQDFPLALRCYQQAETLYYPRIQNGDFLYRKQWERAIEMQAKVRAEILKDLPNE